MRHASESNETFHFYQNFVWILQPKKLSTFASLPSMIYGDAHKTNVPYTKQFITGAIMPSFLQKDIVRRGWKKYSTLIWLFSLESFALSLIFYSCHQFSTNTVAMIIETRLLTACKKKKLIFVLLLRTSEIF